MLCSQENANFHLMEYKIRLNNLRSQKLAKNGSECDVKFAGENIGFIMLKGKRLII